MSKLPVELPEHIVAGFGWGAVRKSPRGVEYVDTASIRHTLGDAKRDVKTIDGFPVIRWEQVMAVAIGTTPMELGPPK